MYLEEPMFTFGRLDRFMTLGYIYFSPQRLKCTDVLDLWSIGQVKKAQDLPHPEHPFDHKSLMAYLVFASGSTPETVAAMIEENLINLPAPVVSAFTSVLLISAIGQRRPVEEDFLNRSRNFVIVNFVKEKFYIQTHLNYSALSMAGHCIMAAAGATGVPMIASFRAKLGANSIWECNLARTNLSESQKRIFEEKVACFPVESARNAGLRIITALSRRKEHAAIAATAAVSISTTPMIPVITTAMPGFSIRPSFMTAAMPSIPALASTAFTVMPSAPVTQFATSTVSGSSMSTAAATFTESIMTTQFGTGTSAATTSATVAATSSATAEPRVTPTAAVTETVIPPATSKRTVSTRGARAREQSEMESASEAADVDPSAARVHKDKRARKD